jgi:hypothetical protein
VSKVQKDMQESIDRICSGQFDKDNVFAFMIRLRELDSIPPILRDLCDFAAHSKNRDRGASFQAIRDLLDNFIKASESKDQVTIPPPIFSKNEIIGYIVTLLTRNNLNIDYVQFIVQSDRFIDLLMQILDGVSYDLKNPKVNECYLEKVGGEVFMVFRLRNLSPQASFRRDGPGLTKIIIFYSGTKVLNPIKLRLQ